MDIMPFHPAALKPQLGNRQTPSQRQRQLHLHLAEPRSGLRPPPPAERGLRPIQPPAQRQPDRRTLPTTFNASTAKQLSRERPGPRMDEIAAQRANPGIADIKPPFRA